MKGLHLMQPVRGRGWLRTATAVTTLLAVNLATAAYAAPKPQPTSPSENGTPPVLAPADGAYLEGAQKFTAVPTTADDSVTELAVDGKAIDAAKTVGTSRLSFDVGSNSTEAIYHSYLKVNGAYQVEIGDFVSERATLEIPNEYLVKGENKVEIVVGAIQNSSCGVNYDDFVLTDVGLELLGEVADGEENPYTFSFGDGSCGSSPTLLKQATLTFTVLGDPQRTTGLAADVDTAKLANGEHTITAATASGTEVAHKVTVNNAPAGAPKLTPTDGTLAKGTQSVFAALPAEGSGEVSSLAVDGGEVPAKASLGTGAATFSFDVGANSIDDKFDNYLLVNGKRIDLGGSWVGQRVSIGIPARFLVPGENSIKVVTGDYAESCGANRDDFVISNLELAFADGTVTGRDIQAAYEMGDGACGTSTTFLRDAELKYAIDAPAVTVPQTLGAGEATLGFTVGGNSIEKRYQNHLLVNGQKVLLDDDYVSRHVDFKFPNEYLVPGWNTIDFVTGTWTTTCANRDDFAISGITLTPAKGTAAGRMVKPSYSMGDGTCGSSVNAFTEVDLEFFVDGPAQGRTAELDTTALKDGRHTLAAKSGTGEEATRALFSDNTAPVVTESVPAAGKKITASVVLDLAMDDMSGIATGPEVTLDGAAIELGTLVGPGLKAGEHTLGVTAADGLGNTATREVKFTSAGIPDAPAELSPALGATDVDGSVTLSAKVAEPDGGKVEATFSQAEIVAPDKVYQGSVKELPTTLKVKGEKKAKTDALAPADGRTLASPNSADITYQRFDLKVDKRVDSPVLRWEGAIDPERLAGLRAWNTRTDAWDLLTSSRGAASGNTMLTAVVDEKYIDGKQVHVMVTGEDPFADDIDAGDPNGFADPKDFDFSIVHFTDTQYLSEGAVEQETAEERAVWEAAYGKVVDWVTANKDTRKIAYAAHTGDIIENNIRKPATEAAQQQVVGEFELSSKLMNGLDVAGVPTGVIAGNHDNQSGTEDGPDAIYNKYYGPDRYQNAASGWKHATYGGPWKEGDNQNHYDLFSAGGLDFVVVGLSYGVTRDEAEWADSIFKKYPERNGILLSHDYLAPSTNPDGRGAGFSAPDGSMLYKTVVAQNPNVFLILAGHEHGVGTNVKRQVGAVGNDVVELLADYQFYTVSADRLGLTEIGGYDPADQLQFGASFLRLLQFDVDRSEMIVDTYSPLLNDFGASEFDTLHRYNGTEDNMVLPVDLTTRATGFQTDSLALYEPTKVIGTSAVGSGQVASVTWKKLKADTAYAWFVTARSTGGGVTASEPSVFLTKDEHGKPGHWDENSPMYPWFQHHEGTKKPRRH
ncbi:metallophosphoesterase [Actinocorallia herbida]|nr:metallophosphoesterase [Actinocorallia herbida]